MVPFYDESVFEKFAKLTGKQLPRNFISNRVADCRPYVCNIVFLFVLIAL